MDYTTHPTDLEAIRLDEFDGTLRQDVPADLREPNAHYVLLRRYVTKAQQREFDRRLREWDRANEYIDNPDGTRTARLTEEQIEKREGIWAHMIAARLIEWDYCNGDGAALSLSAESIDELPFTHVDALVAKTLELGRPRSDEESFRRGRENRSRADERRNGHGPDDRALLADGALVEPLRP